MFLTHVEFSGSGFLAIGRNNQESFVIPDATLVHNGKVIEYLIPSSRMLRKDAEAKVAELYSNKELQEISARFSILHSSGQHYVIHARGPRKLKDKLGRFDYFRPHLSNASEMIRWQSFFPFPDAEVSSSNVFLSGRNAGLADLLNEKKVAIDTEVEGWEERIAIDDLELPDDVISGYLRKKNVESKENRKSLLKNLENILNEEKQERVFMLPYLTFSAFGNYLLTLYDIGADKLTCNTDVGEIEVDVIKCDSGEHFIQKLNELNHFYDPLIVFGHNIGAYDTLKLRGMSKNFAPGKDNSRPAIKAQSGIYKRVQQKGLIVIDSAPFSQNYLPQTADNKLVTVASQLLGIKAEKGISYDELTKLTIEAKLGNRESAREIAEYAVNDCALHYALGEKILEPVLRISFLFGQNPDTICVASKKNTADDLWREKRFWQLKNLRASNNSAEYRNFDAAKLQMSLIFGNNNHSAQSGFSGNKAAHPKNFQARRGIYDAYVIFPAAVVSALENIIAADNDALSVYQKMHSEKDANVKIVYALSLMSYLSEPLFELEKLRRGDIGREMLFARDNINDMDDFLFGSKYGIKAVEYSGRKLISSNVKSANNEIALSMRMLKEYLKDCDVINYSNYFICISSLENDSGKIMQEMERKMLAVNMGSAKILSAAKGRFIAKIGDYIIAESIDASGKKGYRTKLEQQLIPEFGRLVLDNKNEEALSLVIEAARMLANKELSDEDLAYESRPGKEYFQYSAVSHAQERIRNYILHGASKGELVRQMLGNEKEYLDRWFGSQGKTGRRTAEGTIGDYILAAFPTISKGKIDSIASGRQLSLF